jgi:gliding motility-associated-like protein
LTYRWTPPQYLSCTNCPNPTTRLLTQNTRIALTVTDGRGCVSGDSFAVTIVKNLAVFFPTAFSPNNDNTNDFFTVFANNTVKIVRRFQIYNRWGNLVFAKNDLNPNVLAEGWNGKMGDTDAPEGVYVFFAEVEFLDGVRDIYRGEVNLMR